MSLEQEIETRRAEIRSDGYSMSIGELISLYRDDELDIHPEFQRFFRWSEEQKSRLIESILLGIPIPSIFVSQRDDGVWDVIDGLQRLSTIFELVGVLKDEKGETLEPLVLKKTKYLPSLEGKRWDDDDPSTFIGNANRLIIRRSKLDVKIILRESSESSKYELFQRLNTGGSQLSDQEVRNAMLLMINPDAYHWISSLGEDENFQNCIALSERLLSERYDLELVTRFLVFRNLEENELRSVNNIGEFLTDRISDMALSKDFQAIQEIEGTVFLSTFDCLAKSMEDRSFKKYDSSKCKHLGGFLISAFESIALGIGYNTASYDNDAIGSEIEEKVRSLWSDPEFLSRNGRGVNAMTRLRSTLPLGRRRFAL